MAETSFRSDFRIGDLDTFPDWEDCQLLIRSEMRIVMYMPYKDISSIFTSSTGCRIFGVPLSHSHDFSKVFPHFKTLVRCGEPSAIFELRN